MVAFLLRSILLVCYSLTPFWFSNDKLKLALQSFHQGNELAQEGKYKQATRHFQRGIFLGRPTVIKLQEQHRQLQTGTDSKDNKIIDNPHLALEWLLQTYLASARSNIHMGDYEAARRDAWGACLLLHSSQAALACMIEVCQLQHDKIGELSSLRMLLSAVYVQQQEDRASSSYSFLDSSAGDDDNVGIETKWNLQELETRIAQLQTELDATYSTQRNDTHLVDA